MPVVVGEHDRMERATARIADADTDRQEWEDDDPATYLSEVGPDCRRIRQVEVAGDGTALKTDAEDWPFNPPLVDLFDPQLPDQEIDHDEFEQAWATARWEDETRQQ
jgi:hypothetical protein